MSLPSPEIVWLIIGIVFLALEMILPGFVIFFFGIGAWLTALVVFVSPVSLNMQLLIFLVTSLTSLFALRQIIRNTFLGKKQDENEIDSMFHSEGGNIVVVQTIDPPAEGKVSYSGSNWRAVADEVIEEGTVVTIESQDGLVMKVKRKK